MSGSGVRKIHADYRSAIALGDLFQRVIKVVTELLTVKARYLVDPTKCDFR